MRAQTYVVKLTMKFFFLFLKVGVVFCACYIFLRCTPGKRESLVHSVQLGLGWGVCVSQDVEPASPQRMLVCSVLYSGQPSTTVLFRQSKES